MSVAGLIALALYLAILLVKLVRARRYAARHREEQTLDAPITILQPILSGDPFLGDALRANLARTAQDARFLWLVDEDDAEGRRIASSIDDARITVLECPPPRAHENPKTAKLQRALAYVETPYVAVLDDDTIVSPMQLGRAMHALESCTLYTGLPCYLPGPNFWSSLVSHFVNNNSILTYLALPPLTINGMFYAMRTSDLRAMGGFAPIVHKLCDDYALAALVRRHGGTIHQGITPQFLRTTVPGARAYLALMQRWFLFANVLLRDQPARMQVLLIPLLGLPPVFLILSFLSLAGGAIPAAILAVVLIVRHALLRNLHQTFFGQNVGRGFSPPAPGGGGLKPRPALNPFLSVLSELLQPLHWLHACVQHSMQWRTRRIELGRDGTFEYVRSR